MAKLGLFASLAAIVASLSIATLSSSTASADDDKCVRTTFQTEMVKDACKTSQKAAKDAMKKFIRRTRRSRAATSATRTSRPSTSCSPDVPKQLPGEVGGLQRYKDLGGKSVVTERAAAQR